MKKTIALLLMLPSLAFGQLKFGDYPEDTAPTENDYILEVDEDDLTDDPTGSTKFVTYATLRNLFTTDIDVMDFVPQSKTISDPGGAIAVADSMLVQVQSFGGLGTSDTLSNITGGSPNQLLLLYPRNTDSITITDLAGGAGEIDTQGVGDILMDAPLVMLLRAPTTDKWYVITASPNLYTVDLSVNIGLDGLADDSYDSTDVFTGRNAGEALSQWDLVWLNPADGELHIADADESEAAGRVIGMAVTAGTDGNPLTFIRSGVVRNDDWTWSAPNVPLYLSDTPGQLTETAPTTAGDTQKIVAVTLSDDEILLDITHHSLVVPTP